MIKFAPALFLVLMAALQVTAASKSQTVLDGGENPDAVKEAVRSYAEDTGDSPRLGTEFEPRLAAGEEAVDTSSSMVLSLPYIPLLYLAGVSLSLTEVTIEGLDLVNLPAITDLLPIGGVITIPIAAPSLSLNSDHYIAGGKIKSLPFVGESSAQFTLTNLNISLSYEIKNALNLCPKANSTEFEMSLEQLGMNFEDLNPGKNSGDVINAVLNSLTDDITKWLNLLLNEPAGKALLERLIGASISMSQLPNKCNNDLSSGYKQASRLVETGSNGNSLGLPEILTEFTGVLKTVMNMEEWTAFVELVENLLPEMAFGSNADLA